MKALQTNKIQPLRAEIQDLSDIRAYFDVSVK